MSVAPGNEDLVARFYELRGRGDRDGIRRILAEDIAWHDPYPPPHGGDLRGVDAVFADVFDAAAELTEGTTTLKLRRTVATGEWVAAVVDWSSELRGRRMEGAELAVYHVSDGRIDQAWFFPDEQQAAWEFFSGGA